MEIFHWYQYNLLICSFIYVIKQTLQALALERLNQYTEAYDIVTKLMANKINDEIVLSTLTVVLRNMDLRMLFKLINSVFNIGLLKYLSVQKLLFIYSRFYFSS